MSKTNEKIKSRGKRHKKIRTKISGTQERPRISFFKSNKRIYAQLIDDENGNTLIGVSSDKVKGQNMTEKAKEAGKLIAKMAVEKKIKTVVFDRGGFLYSGKVKAFADGAREGGLEF